MKTGRQIEFMQRFAKVEEGGGGLGVMLRLEKIDSDQRLRRKCGNLMDLARCWQP